MQNEKSFPNHNAGMLFIELGVEEMKSRLVRILDEMK